MFIMKPNDVYSTASHTGYTATVNPYGVAKNRGLKNALDILPIEVVCFV